MAFLQRLIHRIIEPGMRMRANQFSALKNRSRNDVVFLGDSITAGGLWPEWFPGHRLRNRGIDGDTTAGVLNRLDSVVDGTPRAIFLLIGTNDIGLGVKPAQIVMHVDDILSSIRRSSPSTRIYLQSVMPRARRFAKRIHALNDQYRQLADTHGASWIDLWPTLHGESGEIRKEFSVDRLHLNGDGYRAWVGVLRPHIEEPHEDAASQ